MAGYEEQEMLTILRIGMETQYYLLKGSVKAVLKLMQYLGRLKEKKIIDGKAFDDFKTFVQKTKGDYQIFNIPTQDVFELDRLRKDMAKIGITYHVLPDLDSSDGLTQIACYSPHAEKMNTLTQNFIFNKLQGGGEKDLSDLQKLTAGDTSIVNIPWSKGTSELKNDLDTLQINYAIMPDLNVGDGYLQVIYANQDAPKLKSWFELFRNDMLREGKPVEDMKPVSMEEYTATGKMTENDYEKTAPDAVKEQVAEYDKEHQNQPFEKALAAKDKDNMIMDERYLQMKEQPGLKEISIDKESLVRGFNDTAGVAIVRLPGTYNTKDNREIDIALSQKDLFAARDGNTYLGFIEEGKEYRTYSYHPGAKIEFQLNQEKLSGKEICSYFEPVSKKYKKVKSVERKPPISGAAAKDVSETVKKATKAAIKTPVL